MTRPEIREQINRLEAKAESAREIGDRAKLYRTLCAIEELQEAAGVQPHEFGGEAG